MCASYVERVIGDCPLILTIPHGGHLKPGSIPRRIGGNVVADGDLHTYELGTLIARLFLQRTRRKVHVVACMLHRSRLDANRGLENGANGNAIAGEAWALYHAAIEDATRSVTRDWGRGLLIDLHGQGHPEQWIEIGYLLREMPHLQLSDAALDDLSTSPLSVIASIAGLVKVRSEDEARPLAPSQLLRGTPSLGGLLESAGYRAIPSPSRPSAAGGSYFNGGYTVRRHGSVPEPLHKPTATEFAEILPKTPLPVDAIQVELPFYLRDPTRPARDEFASTFCDILARYLHDHYNHVLVPKSKPTSIRSSEGVKRSSAL